MHGRRPDRCASRQARLLSAVPSSTPGIDSRHPCSRLAPAPGTLAACHRKPERWGSTCRHRSRGVPDKWRWRSPVGRFPCLRIHGGIQALLESRADLRHQIASCREAHHAYPVRVDVPFPGVRTAPARSPSVRPAGRCGLRVEVRMALALPTVGRARDTILQQHAGDSLDVSQSQTSVPSRSMANTWKPPPGNTTAAAPVFFPLGA